MKSTVIRRNSLVRPLAGAGIEIMTFAITEKIRNVRPLAGAGIEIFLSKERV